MYKLFESGTNGRRREISAHATREEALAALEACGEVVMGDWDEDNADCYDAYLADGRILLIEPAAFTDYAF